MRHTFVAKLLLCIMHRGKRRLPSQVTVRQLKVSFVSARSARLGGHWTDNRKELDMGWTYRHRKKRDELRDQYTRETGRDDYWSPAFEAWLRARGELD